MNRLNEHQITMLQDIAKGCTIKGEPPLARPQYWFALGVTLIIALAWIAGRLTA